MNIKKYIYYFNGTKKILDLYVKNNLINNYKFTDKKLFIFYKNDFVTINYKDYSNAGAFKSHVVFELYAIRDKLDI